MSTTTPIQPAAAPSPAPKYTDIIVAVHGIGAQRRSATVRAVATRFARSMAFPFTASPSLSPQPLGYFHGPIGSVVPLDDPRFGDAAEVGFSEVFWANVPQEVADEKRTLEETKAWGRTVVARARALYADAGRAKGAEIVPADFSLAGEVLDEIIETVYVLENLTFLAKRAGLFEFDLRTMLEEYLGDVQLVAEFGIFSNDIIGHFHRALKVIHDEHKEANIYIVAHSEGTVVSFLGLLMAMSGWRVEPMKADDFRLALSGMLKMPKGGEPPNVCKKQPTPAWLKKVQGFMTIGSPIDKHLLLWRRLWRHLEPARANKDLKASGPIHWRNYYDYGDPVGFKLETARDWLQVKKCTAFEFCGCEKCQHDIGFARYLWPGKAHNDYWEDPAVFEHFIRNVVRPHHDAKGSPAADAHAAAAVGSPEAATPAATAKPPELKVPELKDRFFVRFFSPALPYLLSFLLLFAGVWILYRAVSDYTHPSLDPFQEYVHYALLGEKPELPTSGGGLLLNTLAIALLVSGTTLLARLPRLAFGMVWWMYGLLAFLAGATAYRFIVLPETRLAIGSLFPAGSPPDPTCPTYGVIGIAFFVAVFGLFTAKKQRKRYDKLLQFDPNRRPRRQRWFWRGMRPLILCGAGGLLLIVGSRVYLDSKAPDHIDHIARNGVANHEAQLRAEGKAPLTAAARTKLEGESKRLAAVIDGNPPVWPVWLSGAAFLYLWWLAALIFDLGFVWQRYVRQSTAIERLKTQWADASTDPEEPRRDTIGRSKAPASPILEKIGHRSAGLQEPHRDLTRLPE